jgi:hypothetical protein
VADPDSGCRYRARLQPLVLFAEGPEQELDIPPEWHEAVLYGLASRSAGIFGTTMLDPAKVSRCDTQAKTSYERMLDSDRPDSYYFEYDQPVEVR